MNHPQAPLFEQFLRERTFLKNVTPRTIVWYRVATIAEIRGLSTVGAAAEVHRCPALGHARCLPQRRCQG